MGHNYFSHGGRWTCEWAQEIAQRLRSALYSFFSPVPRKATLCGLFRRVRSQQRECGTQRLTTNGLAKQANLSPNLRLWKHLGLPRGSHVRLTSFRRECGDVSTACFVPRFGIGKPQSCVRFWISTSLRTRPRRNSSVAGGRTGQTVSLGVVLPANVGDREVERARQLPADPMQRIKPRTAATVLAAHLLDHDFRIWKDVQRSGLEPQGALQRFQQSHILGHVIVLAPDPFGDSDSAVRRSADNHSNSRRARIPKRAAIDVGHKIRHCVLVQKYCYQPCLTDLPASRCLTDSPGRRQVFFSRAGAPVEITVKNEDEFNFSFNKQ